MNRHGHQKWKRILPVVIFVIAIVVYLITLIIKLRDIQFASEKQEKYDELFVNAVRMYEEDLVEPEPVEQGNQQNDTDEEETLEEPEIPAVVVDFDYLWSENEDIVAWISIPDTDIDYPILQADDNDYYLNRNLDGSKGRPACIFLDCYNDCKFNDDLSVVYGHNMRNGTMFGKLKEFQDANYFNEHRNLNLYLPNETKNYQIVIASVFSDDYLFADDLTLGQDGRYIFQGMKENEASLFVEKLRKYGDKKANYVADYEVKEQDKLLVLSTCCRDTSKRLLIVCKQIDS